MPAFDVLANPERSFGKKVAGIWGRESRHLIAYVGSFTGT